MSWFTVAHTPEALQAYINRALDEPDFLSRKFNGACDRYNFQISADEISLLGQHFSEAVILKNRPDSLVNNTLRVGFLGMPGIGKTRLSSGIIWGEKEFTEYERGDNDQIVGDSIELGYVCRTDCKSNGFDDYDFDARRELTFDEGRLELIEHVHDDQRFDEALHALFIVTLNQSKPYSMRDVTACIAPELANTNGVVKFLKRSNHFLVR